MRNSRAGNLVEMRPILGKATQCAAQYVWSPPGDCYDQFNKLGRGVSTRLRVCRTGRCAGAACRWTNQGVDWVRVYRA
jgi:hypothetical protein